MMVGSSEHGRIQASLIRLEQRDYDKLLVARLGRFLTDAEDWELFRANPRYIAEKLQDEERPVLSLLVAAVAERMFQMGWQIGCPACGSVDEAGFTLAEIPGEAECGSCGHRFQAHLDDEINVHFTASDWIRPLAGLAEESIALREEVNRRLGRVSAFALLTVPAFRSLIKDQVLPEGQSLGVKRLAVFFSDLRRSTAFYHKLGDAEAYHWVNEHFKIMFAAVEAYGGTAVKTIGDGVMGIFSSPSAALWSIAEAMAGIDQLNRSAGLAEPDRLALKVGLHCGTCIVVTLNGRLDYFGETVNIAARLGALSGGGDVIVSQTVLEEVDVKATMEEMGEVRPIAARLRGLPGHYDLHRIVIRPSD